MVDFVIVAVILIIVGAAVVYILKAKKSGTKCIGCPAGGECNHKCGGASGGTCNCHADTK